MNSNFAILIDMFGRDSGASATLLKVGAAGEKAAASIRTAETSILGFSKRTTAALGAVASVDFAAHIAKDAADFQSQMLKVQTQTGATAKEVANASKGILSMAGSLGTAPQKLAQSIYHFESIGERGTKALNDMKIAAEGAKVGGADLDEVTQSLVYTLQSGIKGANGLSGAMGVFNKVVGEGDMNMSQLVESLGTGGLLANAKNFGVSIQEVGAALAVFGDNGVKGADASTALQQTMADFAKPAAGGSKALEGIGLSVTKLRDDMTKHGLNAAVLDLNRHFVAAGITGTKVGAELTEIFTKRASKPLGILMGNVDLFESKLKGVSGAANNFGKAWAATQKSTSFAFDSLRAGLEAAGIELGTKLLPLFTSAANFATGSLGPALATPWHVLKGALSVTAGTLSAISKALGALHLPIAGIGVAAAGAYAGFRVFTAIPGLIADVGIVAKGAALNVVDFGASISTTATKWLASTEQITAATSGMTAAVIADMSSIADEALLMSGEFGAAAVAVAGSADTAAASVVASGETASVGWAGMLGPLGAAAVGVGLLVSIFHKSSSASKEATAAAKAYSDALSSGSGKSDFVDTISTQLKNNNLAPELDKINKSMGRTAFTGAQFVHAIQAGNPALGVLRTRLQAVVDAGTQATPQGRGVVYTLTPAAQAATKALRSLNVQQNALTGEAKKEYDNAKAFGVVEGAVQKTTVATMLGTDAAKQYATMAGLQVDKNGIVAASQQVVNAAVNNVATAYDRATASGSDFLASLDTFSKSAGTASDRAALIGSILKANAGDALSYAATMNTAAAATAQLHTDIASAAKSANEGTGTYLRSIVNLKNGSIDYSKTAAAPLISNLQSIQTAAINAATATYQHERATLGAGRAADDATAQYKGVEDSLVNQLVKMHLSRDAAQQLTDKYLGVPSHVKTLIEQAGANPVVTVLNKIGTQLAYLTGHPWNTTITLDGTITPEAKRILAVSGKDPNRLTSKLSAPGLAVGGTIRGPGTGTSDSVLMWGSNGEEVVNAKQSAKHRPLIKAINAGVAGFAAGGTVAATQSWLRNKVDALPYVWGAAGPWAYDCSGLVGAAIEHLTGRGKGRLFSTSNEAAVLRSLGFKKGAGGANALMVAGWNSEHTTGSVGGLKFEAFGSNGVPLKDQIRIGSKARDPRSFPSVMHLPNGADGIRNTKPGGNPKITSTPAVSTTAAAAQLFGAAGKAGSFGSQLISGVSNSASKIGVSSGSAAAAQAAVGGRSAAVVNGALAGSVAPDVTQAQLIGSKTKPGLLGGAITGALGSERTAEIAAANYQKLAANVAKLKTQVAGYNVVSKTTINRWRDQADADSKQARALSLSASKMSDNTKAQKAAKKAVEEHAAALRGDAADLRARAAAATRNNAAGKSALQAQLTAAQTLAARAKDAYGSISQAAKDAAQKATAYAKQLVDSVKSDADTLVSTISDFKSSMQSSIAGDNSISSLWQALYGATDADGNPIPATLTALQSNLNTVLTNTQAFAADLTSLVGEGANQDLITQVTSLGTTAGDALAKQLLAAGPTAITALQTTMASIQSVASSEAQQLATSFYGPGATAMIQFIAGLESQFPALTSALQTVANAVAAAAGVNPSTIKSPAAGLTKAATSTKPPPGTYSYPSFASGVTNFGTGLAFVHQGEALVNFRYPGNDVLTKSQTAKALIYSKPHTSAHYSVDTSGIEKRLDSVLRQLESSELRLKSMETTIAATPAQFGDQAVRGYEMAGQAHARQLRRQQRQAG